MARGRRGNEAYSQGEGTSSSLRRELSRIGCVASKFNDRVRMDGDGRLRWLVVKCFGVVCERRTCRVASPFLSAFGEACLLPFSRSSSFPMSIPGLI